jgi:bacteriocin biosynthesis cyclodehydratase domain-containing protein
LAKKWEHKKMTKPEISLNTQPIHILSRGAFGEAVTARLTRFLPDLVQISLEDATAAWPKARINLVVSGQPIKALLRLLDEASFASQTPFIAVVMVGTRLQIGPIVWPGKGACYSCFEKRQLQHSLTPELDKALDLYYEANPARKLQGYLPAFAEIAALRVAQLVNLLESEGEETSQVVGGQVWQLDIISRQITTSTVVGIHGCVRCGLGRDEQTRSYKELQDKLLAFLNPTHATSAALAGK